jgi:holo-[acyl-carrier protein] synthase
MRIAGMGVDIIEISRVESALTARLRMVERVYTEEEIAYCRSKPASMYAHFAGRFAAKEAVAKALGRSLEWRDVSIENDPLGKPRTVLRGPAADAAEGGLVLVSISHSRDYAVAHAVFVRPEGESLTS